MHSLTIHYFLHSFTTTNHSLYTHALTNLRVSPIMGATLLSGQTGELHAIAGLQGEGGNFWVGAEREEGVDVLHGPEHRLLVCERHDAPSTTTMRWLG